PKPLVNRFAAVIRRNQYNIKESMRALFLSEGFYDPSYRGSLIKSPVELVIGTSRQLGLPLENLNGAVGAASRLGQELYEPPNVKGWDGGPKWINTATLFGRYNAVRGMIFGEGGQRHRSMAALNDEEAAQEKIRTRRGFASQTTFDPLPLMTENNLESAEQVVDFFLGHLLAVPLATEKRAALISYLEDGLTSFDPQVRKYQDRIRTLVYLICSTPEYQLN
ncbi:MAG: DUF1800 family protein, partial [Phycisphaerae bacterium]